MAVTATEKKPVEPTLPRLCRSRLSDSYARGRLRTIAARRVRGRFDSAATPADNRRHWANADALSADSAASADVRRTLRNRARYEVANNSYARGIVLTLANDTIGTGPRLQMLTDADAVNREVERQFQLWAQEVSLAEKLRTMRMARAQDGETFGMLANNPMLDHPVKLDLRLTEGDQGTSPMRNLLEDQEVDGAQLDALGNPVVYHVLKEHHGGSRFAFTRTAPDNCRRCSLRSDYRTLYSTASGGIPMAGRYGRSYLRLHYCTLYSSASHWILSESGSMTRPSPRPSRTPTCGRPAAAVLLRVGFPWLADAHGATCDGTTAHCTVVLRIGFSQETAR